MGLCFGGLAEGGGLGGRWDCGFSKGGGWGKGLCMHSPALSLRRCLLLLLMTAACAVLPGCVTALLLAGSTDISKDARFAPVLGRELRTQVEMRLYEPENGCPDDMRGMYDLTNVRGGAEDRVATVPAGHAVRFDRAVRWRGLDGGTTEYLYGAVTIRGRSYPVHYYLGCGAYPESWRRMYGVFAVRE